MAFLKNTSSHALSDGQLVQQYKETGDLAILGELYQRYMELVYGVCLKYFKEPETAKDAVMQIFEELVTKLRRHEVDNFRGWLHQVAKNHCLMQLRTPRNLKTVEYNAEVMQNEESVHLNGILEKEEHFKQLENCLGTLTSDQQEAIRLFYLEGKCYNEIVEQTGREWNQVRSFIQNGRRNLKICMEKSESALSQK
ncbi:MAG: sigma-70 family RNA polymerase sigma factor [Terrimonas ferruginea]|uniref:RNA polymerase sigma factor n=1 Tax=Terrimonas ferruginea TaxID=249 RepID=UPI000929570F|nr:sigma-70 family RNA polymerase sigma factor [Terrimonas ferruginea]MBN8783938.1 sigma-70 family RNA polymerase sigma factor [Terrimonas ferruginea]OJW41750.1 MAG: RNA polymerase subunit sigma-70 [Sphingobacteriales bacterium 48-107]